MKADCYCKITKYPLDQMAGGQIAVLIAAILTGWGQLSPAAAILLGLGLSVVVTSVCTAIGSLLWAAQIAAATGAQYISRISQAAARAIAEAVAAIAKEGQIRTAALALQAQVRRFEAIGIINPNITAKVVPSPI